MEKIIMKTGVGMGGRKIARYYTSKIIIDDWLLLTISRIKRFAFIKMWQKKHKWKKDQCTALTEQTNNENNFLLSRLYDNDDMFSPSLHPPSTHTHNRTHALIVEYVTFHIFCYVCYVCAYL